MFRATGIRAALSTTCWIGCAPRRISGGTPNRGRWPCPDSRRWRYANIDRRQRVSASLAQRISGCHIGPPIMGQLPINGRPGVNVAERWLTRAGCRRCPVRPVPAARIRTDDRCRSASGAARPIRLCRARTAAAGPGCAARIVLADVAGDAAATSFRQYVRLPTGQESSVVGSAATGPAAPGYRAVPRGGSPGLPANSSRRSAVLDVLADISRDAVPRLKGAGTSSPVPVPQRPCGPLPRGGFLGISRRGAAGSSGPGRSTCASRRSPSHV